MRPRPAPSSALVDFEGRRLDGAILVVEESERIGGELVEQLRADGYPALHARTAEHARVLARGQPIRAIALGALDAPRGALDLLEEIRRPSDRWRIAREREWEEQLPVIVLSPGATQLDLLRAFETGADDFIAHPARYLELRARLRAVLRRAERATSGRLLRAGQLEIDTAAHRVRFAGAAVELSRLEYELLVHLARDPRAVCSKQELLRTIWSSRRSESSVRTVDSHASRLRRKLDAAGASGHVVNVWGVGYRLL
ncbi:MAG TPA: response regulator transcription factor [Solirubrobacteraceae bacterium]|jgi:DNA-binding response OmpR family regulator